MKKTAYVSLCGMLCAAALLLSFIEGLIPTAGLLPPGVKLGLSNVVTMFAAFSLGFPAALSIALFKAFFALLTRGALAGLLSLCGGVLSVCLLCGLLKIDKSRRLSFLFLSITGSVCHNLGQLTAVMLITSFAAVYYAPILIISAVAAGSVTSFILKATWKYMHRLEANVKTVFEKEKVR